MAAGISYTPITTTTLGSAQSSVTFSSISGSYTDLVIVATGAVAASASIQITFNSDTGTNYSRTFMYGTGSSAASGRNTSANYIRFGLGTVSGSNIGNAIINVQNYSNSTTYKTVLIRNNDTLDAVVAEVGLWRSTSAITSITFTGDSGNISSGSTFSLYGITAA